MEDSRQDPIGRTLLQVEDGRSDGISDLLGAHGSITAPHRRRCGGSEIRNRVETV